MRQPTQRAAQIVVTALVVLSLVTPAAAAAAAPTTPSAAPLAQQTANETNATETEAEPLTPIPEDQPSAASQVRLNPAVPDADYVGVTAVETDETYNTSGTFTAFDLSTTAQSARVSQPGADARLLGGGNVVQVQYEADAAPRDATTLYTLELFFADGSTKEVDLYATKTDVSAQTQIGEEYREVIQYLEGQTEDTRFNSESPEGLINYVQFKEERAQLLEGLWTDEIQKYIGLSIAMLFSPFHWVTGFTLVAVVALYLNRKHGHMLEKIGREVSERLLKREAIRQDYEEHRNAAAKHKIGDVEGVGRNAARYWKNVGIETVEDMVQRACRGLVAVDENGRIEQDDDGNDIFLDHGVPDLQNAKPLTEKTLREKTWLQPLILEGRLRATTALSNIEQALLTAEREYGRGNEVRQTRMQVQELLAELRGDKVNTDTETSTRGPNLQTRDRATGTGDRPGSGTGTGAD